MMEFGCVFLRFALFLAFVLCWAASCIAAWVLLGLWYLLRLTECGMCVRQTTCPTWSNIGVSLGAAALLATGFWQRYRPRCERMKASCVAFTLTLLRMIHGFMAALVGLNENAAVA